MEDHDIRAALDRHWAASDANDFEAEHQIYREDAVLEYPQSGERIRGRHNIQASRFAQPSSKRLLEGAGFEPSVPLAKSRVLVSSPAIDRRATAMGHHQRQRVERDARRWTAGARS